MSARAQGSDRHTDSAARGGARQAERSGGLKSVSENIRSVPERIGRPRLIFISAVVALIAFGLLMIYSSSSIKALNEYDSASYYVVRQLRFVVLGIVLAGAAVAVGYERLTTQFVYVVWGVTLAMLLATLVLGKDAGGATRWIEVGGFRFQPSEFAKPAIVLVAAALLDEVANGLNLKDRAARKTFFIKVFFGVIVPIGLILLQPDKGSTMILGVTLVVMVYLSGLCTGKQIIAFSLVVGILFIGWSMRDDYSRARIFTMMDPWSDPYGDGYQLTQGFLAFGLGGVKGVGIAMSTQKYAYLPEAHNDFIFAIVGEEMGLLGTLLVVVAFVFLLVSGFGIASSANNPRGRLVAVGATSLLVVQFLVNVCGVLGIIPLSGKPIPFLSYGGTAALAFLIDVGLVLSVSMSSTLPTTEYETQRAALRVSAGDADADEEAWPEEPLGGFAGRRGSVTVSRVDTGRQPTSAAGASSPLGTPSKLRLVQGGDTSRSAGPDGMALEGAQNARITRRDGRDRIELGRTSYDRLRNSRGPSGSSGSSARLRW